MILIDIGLSFEDALRQLIEITDKNKIKLHKIIVCSKLGTPEKKIFYGKVQDFKNSKIKVPFCFIIPGKTHFLETEILKEYEI